MANNVWFETVTEMAKQVGPTVFTLGHPIPAGLAVAVALGYSQPGDGGGGLFYWDASSEAQPDNGTIFAVPLHEFGRWIRLDSGSLNVLWFGADRSGRTDSTAAFAAAIAAAALVNGQTILIPAGSYRVNNLSITSNNIHLQGAGKSGAPSDTCPSPAGGTQIIFANGNFPGFTIIKDTLSIRDITFVTQGSGPAIRLERFQPDSETTCLCSNKIIEGCSFVGCSGGAISSDDNLVNIVLRDCLFASNPAGSNPVVLLTGGNSTTIYVENCYFSNNQNDPSGVALQLGALDICHVRNCIIESSGTAIRLDNESGCIIEGCHFEVSVASHTIDQTLGSPAETPGLIQINGCSFSKGATQSPIIDLPDAKTVEVSNCHFNGYSNSDQLLPGTLAGKVRLAGNYSEDASFNSQLS
jgi:hypothetical protein